MSRGWIVAIAMVGITAVSSGGAHAQMQVLGPNPVIGGVPVSCFGANTIVAPINDIAMARPGVIYLNSGSFFQYPAIVQVFTYAHECAHQVPWIGSNEQAADCWAVKLGRAQGWLSPQGLSTVQAYFVSSPGDWTHAPGPYRVGQMEQCYLMP